MRAIQTAILAVPLGISSLTFAADEFNKECAMGLAMVTAHPNGLLH